MSGLQFAWRKGPSMPTPLVGEALVGKSTQIHAGDILIKTTNSTYTGTGASQYPVVRALLSGDTITVSNGIFGVALFDIQTDSSGNVVSVASPVTVDTRGQLLYRGIGQSLPRDPVSTYTRIYVALFDPANVFAGLTTTNEAANFYDVGRAAGLVASAATPPANYTLEVAPNASNAPLIVEGVDTEFPQFNSANGGGRLFVSGRPTYYEGATGTLWTS